ncbi:3-oxoacyl-[acyl-carrier-protein] synthase III C-terminal domain-containing protein [Fluviispira vulneris]|uniref:3-oxoacyl-[acyl-carrier-protein] synthase III C-terminal domain-containing protein n=1 Tax=Fluviispira vulneris TaxID=2763012 RepID=UPI0016470D7A|nr:3-oxoacyl-[acyl-carrier-protein] synthase III C-terminal domain-containing protein [Fluviispira vulneris]
MRFILYDFHIIRPQYESIQGDALNWIAQAHAFSKYKESLAQGRRKNIDEYYDLIQKIVLRFACKPEKISKRGSDISDFLHTNWDAMEIFNLNKSASGVFMHQRMQFFEYKIQNILQIFYKDVYHAPQNLIHVSCTGYVSPSAPQKLVAERGWGSFCQVTHAYHMGCYASLPAIRMGKGFLQNENRHQAINEKVKKKVDIIHNELCTLHFNPAAHDPEQIVVQSLFADGHIKYSICESNDYSANDTQNAFEIIVEQENLYAESFDAMTWRLSDFGFQMTISRKVPSIIAENIEVFLNNLFDKAGMNFSDEKEKVIFAIHPGGPKIIEYIRDILNLSAQQIKYSQSILFEYGNMSSATLPHIWERISQTKEVIGMLVVSLAFGPGLTMSGSIMRVI